MAEPEARATLESLVGGRFAPRAGAVLVFLGTLFFLGVAIQRGWIGPIAQLLLAAGAGAALLGAGAWLTSRRGYGTYPQVLEITGVCLLYVTAFVAHALPDYREATGMGALASGFLMALVAAGTVGLALVRDARIMAGLGYVLGFLTAGVGTDVLPELSLVYVGLLGTSLALVIARKRWILEAVAGTLATGAWLSYYAFRALDGTTSPWWVLAAGLPPAVAFVWLTLRPAESDPDRVPRDHEWVAVVALFTLPWAVVVTLPLAFDRDPATGVILLVWSLVAAGLAALGARLRAERHVAGVYAGSALLLYLAAPPILFEDFAEPGLWVTGAYAVAAVLVALLSRFPSQSGRAEKHTAAAAVLALAAMVHPVMLMDALSAPWDARASEWFGPWQAWAALALLGPPLAALVATARTPAARSGATILATAFLALWVFALLRAPWLTTGALLLLALGLLGVGIPRGSRELGLAGVVLLLLASLKVAVVDQFLDEAILPPGVAIAEALVAAGAMIAVYHLAVPRLGRDVGAMPLAVALLGGSAAALASAIFAQAEGPAVSILLGALGVGYLVAGFVLREHAVYRYTAFGILALVIARLFVVDLRETDLAVRALVFVVLGAVLLGIGYAYARINRKESAPPKKPTELSVVKKED